MKIPILSFLYPLTTAKGIEGIPLHPRREALIADDWQGFAGVIQSRLRNPDAAETMGVRRRRFVECLGWRDVTCRYIELL